MSDGTLGSSDGLPRTFAELLRSNRLAIGLSQEVLAERAGLSNAAVAALEQGARLAPYRDTIARLADALSLTSAERAALENAANRARARSPKRPALVASSPNNLPTLLTTFIPRDEVRQIGEAIATHRLVTVTGSGGVGKTRTVLEVASHRLGMYPGGIWFADLAPIRDGARVVAELASAMKIPRDLSTDLRSMLLASLSDRRCLLVIDNCEHLIAHVADIVGKILECCTEVSILATSRERLALSAEAVFRLPSLKVPARVSSIEAARAVPALALFLDRVRSSDIHFNVDEASIDEVIGICRDLEGIPLAIELAAARAASLGLTNLRTRLDAEFGGSRFRDAPGRHQTMTAAIAWSFDLLSNDERVMMGRLSVFSGGFTLESAEHVCSDDRLTPPIVSSLLTSLIEKSLVDVVTHGPTSRYRLLETVRVAAVTLLENANEFTSLSRRHAQWLSSLGQTLNSLSEAQLAPFIDESDNLRAAITWCLNSPDESDDLLAVSIVRAFYRVWRSSNRLGEAASFSRALLARMDEARNPDEVATLLATLGMSTVGPEMLTSAESAIPLLERLGDVKRLSSILNQLSIEYCYRGRFELANAMLDRLQSLSISERGPAWLAQVLDNAAWVFSAEGRIADARRALADSKALTAGLADPAAEFNNTLCLAEVEYAAGNPAIAADLCRSVLERGRALGYGQKRLSLALCNLSSYSLVLGEIDEADRTARDFLTNWSTTNLTEVVSAIQNLATVGALTGNPTDGARLLGCVDAWYERHSYVRPPTEHGVYDILLTSLRKQLSEIVLDSLHTSGAAMSLEQGLHKALALSVDD